MLPTQKGTRGASLVTLATILATVSSSLIVDTSMSLCPRGSIYTGGQALVTLPARSLSECAVRCSETWTCGSFNFCRGQSISCQLMGLESPSHSCGDLDPAPSCRHGIRRKLCQNGGTLEGLQCTCQRQYAGQICHRYIRDCEEAYDRQTMSSADNGVFTIQPAGAPLPFWVYCHFGSLGDTHSLRRRDHHHLYDSLTWQQALDGFWVSRYDYFIGLRNLHLLSTQAQYKGRQGMSGGSVIYENITIGPESASFELGSNNLLTISSQGLVGSPPLTFATADNDPNGCAAVRGGAGWYGTECSGSYSMFAQPLLWPVNGAVETMTSASLFLMRQSDYY